MQKKKEINIEVGHRIQLSRERAGYTQEQFAELLDVGVQHVSNIERGAVGISLTALKKTCEILGVSADYLLLGGNASEEGNILLRQLRRASGRSGRAGGTRHFSIAVRAGACQRQQKGLVRFAGLLFVERHLFIGKKQNRTKEGRENSVVLCAFLVKSP